MPTIIGLHGEGFRLLLFFGAGWFSCVVVGLLCGWVLPKLRVGVSANAAMKLPALIPLVWATVAYFRVSPSYASGGAESLAIISGAVIYLIQIWGGKAPSRERPRSPDADG